MLDTLRRVPTPEGIELSLRLAGPVPRAYAFATDLLIRGAILLALIQVVAIFGRSGTGPGLILFFLLEWFYPVAFEIWWNGATPGKRAFSLMVVNDNGTPVTVGASVTRNLLRIVDFLPMLWAFGLISMLFSRDFKRLGDLAAGTVVVYRDRVRMRGALPDVPPLMPAFPLSLAERRAVLNFAERHALLTEERADEVASHAGPLVGNNRVPARVILGIARHHNK
ncbi:MAG: transporter [Betaproteobacteria bacterium]|nr:transporter [Betaproteobacteria bacterium]